MDTKHMPDEPVTSVPPSLNAICADLSTGADLVEIARCNGLSLLQLARFLAQPHNHDALAARGDRARLRADLLTLEARAAAIDTLKRLQHSPTNVVSRQSATALLRAPAGGMPPPAPTDPPKTPPDSPPTAPSTALPSAPPPTAPPPTSSRPSSPPSPRASRGEGASPPGEADEGPSFLRVTGPAQPRTVQARCATGRRVEHPVHPEPRPAHNRRTLPLSAHRPEPGSSSRIQRQLGPQRAPEGGTMNRTFGRPNGRRHGLSAASIAMVLAAGLSTTAAAGPPCKEGWSKGDRGAPFDGYVEDMVVWDDGRGPAAYMAGSFAIIDGLPATTLVRWNGHDWSPVGDQPISGAPTQIEVWQNKILVFGGQNLRTPAGAAGTFATWDGSVWQSLDPRLANTPDKRSASEDRLVIAGARFVEPSGEIVDAPLAEWTGAGWQIIPGILSSPDMLHLFVDSQGILAIGNVRLLDPFRTEFFALWDGTGWTSPFPSPPRFLSQRWAYLNGTVFTWDPGRNEILSSSGGPWTPSEAGPLMSTGIVEPQLQVVDGKIWVVGDGLSRNASDEPTHFMILDGDHWTPFGPRFGSHGVPGGFTRWGDQLLAADVSLARKEIFVVTPDAATPIGPTPVSQVIDLLSIEDDLLALVRMDTVPSGTRLSRRDGDEWVPVADLSAELNQLDIDRACLYRDQVYVIGDFTQILSPSGPPRVAFHIARWDGAEWQPLGSGFDLLCSPFDLEVFGDELVTGGRTEVFLPGSPNRIQAWNGSSFRTLGGTVTGVVQALEPFDGSLIAGGSVTSIGPVTVNRIARWDGAAWHPMGDGFDSSVHALVVHNGQLIAGGQFTASGSTPLARIARWDGAAWQPLGRFDDGTVETLAVIKGQLVAGGTFTTSDGVEVNRIARWDGAAWQPFDEGVRFSTGGTPTVRDIIEFEGDMLIAGNFSAAGLYPSAGMATWGCTEPSCPTDLTGASHPSDPRFGIPDGQLTEADFEYFLGLFIAGDPVADFTGSADPSDPAYGAPDGRLTAEDMFYYLDLFDQGCG